MVITRMIRSCGMGAGAHCLEGLTAARPSPLSQYRDEVTGSARSALAILNRPGRAAASSAAWLEPMVDMIVDEGALRARHGLLDRIELLRDVDAGVPLLDHGDDAAEMPRGSVQAA